MDREQEIDYVLSVLSDYWHAKPELRLTQLMWNQRTTELIPLEYVIGRFYNMNDMALAEKLSKDLTDGCR